MTEQLDTEIHIETSFQRVRKLQEIALSGAFANEELTTALDSIPDYFLMVDTAWRITFFNAAYEARYGISRQDVIGQSMWDVFPSLRGTAVEEVSRRAMDEHVVVTFEHYSLIVSRWYDMEAVPTRRGLCIYARDITDKKHAEAALRDSEERFRLTFDRAAIGMGLVSLEGQWIRVNQVLCETLGYTERELLELTFQDITHPDDLDLDLSLVRRLLAGDVDHYNLEKRYLHKNGHIIWALLNRSLVRDEDGSPVHFIAQVQDVTSRKRAEHNLRERSEAYRTLADNLPDIVARFDRQRRHLYINRTVEQMTGQPRLTFIGKTFAELGMTHEGVIRIEQAIERVFLTGAGETIDYDVVSARGRSWYETRLSPEYTDDRSVTSVLCVTRDITERKIAEEALAASEERFRSAFDHAAVGVTLRQLNGDLVRVNARYCQLLGMTSEEVFSSPLVALHQEDADGDYSEQRVRMIHGEIESFQIERRLRHKEGHEIDASIHVSLVRDAHGSPEHLVSQVLDVTEQRKAEAELRHSNDALERSNRALQEFTSVASHDLKAPLVSIQGLARMLQADFYDVLHGDGQLYVDRIVVNAGKLRQLLDDLLEISRVGNDEGDVTLVDLASIIDDVTDQLRQRLDERGASVVVDGYLPNVSAKRVSMHQVFANLIDNAVQYTPLRRAPRITISATDRGDAWEIAVSDNGAGIPPESRDKVFAMFQRLPSGASLNPTGTGMGLAIVARIIEANGGRCWIGASDSTGTTICLTLPKHDEAIVSPKTERS